MRNIKSTLRLIPAFHFDSSATAKIFEFVPESRIYRCVFNIIFPYTAIDAQTPEQNPKRKKKTKNTEHSNGIFE